MLIHLLSLLHQNPFFFVGPKRALPALHRTSDLTTLVFHGPPSYNAMTSNGRNSNFLACSLLSGTISMLNSLLFGLASSFFVDHPCNLYSLDAEPVKPPACTNKSFKVKPHYSHTPWLSDFAIDSDFIFLKNPR
jgi:hypothetical protein